MASQGSRARADLQGLMAALASRVSRAKIYGFPGLGWNSASNL
jgi:hypothetical protein